MLDKSFHIKIETPLGVEDARLVINNSCGSIQINKGSANIEDIKYNDNTITCSITTDVPFVCKIVLSGTVKNDIIFGTINLDEYLIVPFNGKETDGKPIPNLC